MIDPYHPSTILMSTLNTEDEKVAEYSFRPQNFDDYIGQEQVKKTLKMMLESAVVRNKAMDHVLFYGPPGLGKTSLAFLLSQVAQRKLHIVVGGAIEKKS
jgi:Holliday junction DNA helicase RuvB